ncbi:MAG: SAVED domain-containing protein [Candidatus Paceibacterota bacterium]
MSGKNTPKKRSRPTIPIKTQLQLWVKAGGRCEHPGCNEIVLRDKTTLSEGNYSNIAHIISWTPTGPRGDKKLSSKLAKDLSNLMLMCLDHSKKIDRREHFALYTIDYLRKAKSDHEDRINIQTSIDPSRKTTVVRLQSNIRGRRVEVDRADAYTALITADRYPNDEKGIFIDLTNLNYDTENSSWDVAVKKVDAEVSRLHTIGNDERKESHLSVFALAPIPVLAYLGYALGNIINTDIYIKRREQPWSITSAEPTLSLKLIRSRNLMKSKTVGLTVAISGEPSNEDIRHHIGKAPLYTITVKKPELDQIISSEDLEAFRKIYRETLDEIQMKHGKRCEVHLFGAMPTCAAIVCGREILHGTDPVITVYEYVSQEEGYVSAIKFNNIRYGATKKAHN